jgi:predicted naringenin-chalcone synthase
LERRFVSIQPRILSVGTALPRYFYKQEEILRLASERILGPSWESKTAAAPDARRIARLFAATGVAQRSSAVDLNEFYDRPRSTGERMATYRTAALELGRAAMRACLAPLSTRQAADISDLICVSCTGYSAPGLDIELAGDLHMPGDVRRLMIGHMGCYGAMVALRQALATVRADPNATVAIASVELSMLHFFPSLDTETITSMALFGDAGAAVLIGDDRNSPGPEVVDTYCAADFGAADQMTWTITDQGFAMRLSPRVPVTLRRHLRSVVEHLLDPHGLALSDVAHWLIHPGGPSILEVAKDKLELSDDQLALSWEVLRDHGNCSSATVLLILDRLLRAGRTRRGEWGVMIAFGPGLTLETCLLRF